MILKILGMILIFTSSTLIGMYFGSRGRDRIEDLREFKKAFLILKAEIQYVRTPLGECFSTVHKKTKYPINKIFKSLQHEIDNYTQIDLWKIWEKHLLSYKNETSLKNEDISFLKDFGKCLGFLDKSMQEKNIDLTISIIDEQINRLGKDVAKDKKMFNSLGALAGLLICILLI